MSYAKWLATDHEGQLHLPFQHNDNTAPNTSSVVRLPVSSRRNDGRGTHANRIAPAPQLTARERQVLDLLVRGLSSKCIAHELVISPRTVEVHRANLMRKMGVRNIATLIRAVFESA